MGYSNTWVCRGAYIQSYTVVLYDRAQFLSIIWNGFAKWRKVITKKEKPVQDSTVEKILFLNKNEQSHPSIHKHIHVLQFDNTAAVLT